MQYRAYTFTFLAALALLDGPAWARQIQPVPPLAQPAAPAVRSPESEIAGCKVSKAESGSFSRQPVETADGIKEDVSFLISGVRVDCDQMQFFADHAEIYSASGKVTARGNVLFVSGGNRISAQRMEFDTRTRTGTFYDAYGIASLGERADRSLFGTQEPDAMFWGREVQKIGPRKYRIKSGGFTTCVQPTPRWDVASGTLTLTLDDHALMTNSVFRVKGVPVMYLPVFYYPIQEDDRATGFTLPTYGTSTVQGQTLRNAFFWAIGRSHDATFYHDWFSKTGFGYGTEYRYELGGGSQGRSEIYVINEKETTFTSGGTEVTQPAKRSYQINGALNQALGGGFRARANADYFSDIVTQQRYHQNVQRATNRTRRFGGNITGTWAGSVLSATLDRHDVFYPDGTITTTGGLPRVTISRGERAIGRSPFYFGASGEYVTLLRKTASEDETILDQGLTRMEVTPTLRIPFTRWPFLSVNSSVAWRGTYWSESIDELTETQVQESVGRQYFDLTARVTGPVFNRIFNTPGGGYAEKFKHVVEPTLVIQRITAIDQFDRIVKLDGTDFVVGNVTRFSYGLNNRLYAKKNVSREILSLIVGQTYYTDENASRYDQNYQSSLFTGTVPSKFSPVSVQVRTSPTERIQGEFRTEWDHTVKAFRTFAASGIVNREVFQLTAGWSQRRYIPDLPGFDDELRADHYINASASVRGLRNRIGGTYSFNYDLRRDNFLQQRYLAYYNAQCCGIAVEYQTFNFTGGFAGVPIPQDRRFNISFTLAGIGSFSNVLGAFGGGTGR